MYNIWKDKLFMKFSIIIPAYNEEKYIGKGLESIKNK
jgi:glycosyltransferase involved in cell wall biosynthesis